MKYTIFFVLAAFGLSLLWACSGNKNKVTTTVDEDGQARKTVQISTKLLTNKWKHVRSKDSYDGEWREIAEDNRVIEFSDGGRYIEERPGNPTHQGTYTLTNDQLIVEHSGNNMPLKYKVYFIDKKKMTLTIQGRHGKVFQDYVKVK